MMAFRHDNHYVACLYLKRFSSDPGHVFTYRILVAHPRVPEWKRDSIKGVAYHKHLYTRIISGVESDEIETWLDRDFEAPAEEPLRKATAGLQLAKTDWYNIIRFLAAQDVRTPARLTEVLSHSNEIMSAVLQECAEGAVQKLEEARRSGKPIKESKFPDSEILPLRVTTEIKPGQEFGTLKAETIVGRSAWLFSIKHLLSHTANILQNHKWTILRPADGMSWFTSDNPVVRLNYYSDQKYNFDGGWGSPGTEILLPLDPQHLLYTKIGQRPLDRGSVVSRAHTKLIRRVIAEHAHRYIFSSSEDVEIPRLRPRTVSADAVRHEKEQWQTWHEDQSKADRELMGWGGS
ncbi:MAG: DUF4238 domain-containing protein [Acidobacteriia bacterium]|nr:DUF4238 domain-containing protein [Terriglobia bacterium]